MVAGAVSACLPPWFETQMPATPALTASLASSGCKIPGRLEALLEDKTFEDNRQFRYGTEPFNVFPR